LVKPHKYYVYILASKKNGVLYIGITNNLPRRIQEHKEGLVEGHSKKYFIKQLVYIEAFDYIDKAIEREKCLKRWKRKWKIELIEKLNPEWKDLYENIQDWI